MDMVKSYGVMVQHTKENGRKDFITEMEVLTIMMGDFMKDNFVEDNITEWEHSLIIMVKNILVYQRKVRFGIVKSI